jgi:hypothetical protein
MKNVMQHFNSNLHMLHLRINASSILDPRLRALFDGLQTNKPSKEIFQHPIFDGLKPKPHKPLLGPTWTNAAVLEDAELLQILKGLGVEIPDVKSD